MSQFDPSEPKIGPFGPTYIIDFLEYLKARNLTSRDVVLAAIQAARLYGPVVAKAEKIADGVYGVRVHVGYGLNAIIEMDLDRDGKLSPVLGEIVKE